jgi:hypothetical protein
MNVIKNNSQFGRKRILAAVIPLILAGHSQAFEFYSQGIEGSFDSEISMGSSWRVESQDEALLKNGNFEDGNANFNSGDAFSQVFKGSHDLQLSYENFGGFVRGKYWYDSALADNNVNYGHGSSATVGNANNPLSIAQAGSSHLDDSEFNDNAKFSGVQLLDAYVYGQFSVMDMPLDLRLGKQVVSWGESTFILGGINAINSVDVNAYTRPGAKIKEVLLPLNMAYTNIGLSDNLSLEAFYQLEFQQTVLPGCGTFFSINDYAPEGCDVITLEGGTASLQRHEDGIRKPSSDGQFGLSFRFVSSSLNDSEFGLYALNIHSRTPMISGTKSPFSNAQLAGIGQAGATDFIINNAADPTRPTLQELGMAQQVGLQTAGGAVLSSSHYFISYPEDMQLYGFSFATTVGSVALSGEINHKIDMPIQINGSQLLTAALQGNTASLAPLGMASTIIDNDVAAVTEGGDIQGYRSFDVTQAQLTVVRFLDQLLGADRFTLVAEAGYSFIHKFDEGNNAIKFGRADYFDTAGDTGGFVTQSSWGYRVLLEGDYSDVFYGINLTPSLAWSEDVKGFGANSAGNFQEGQQSIDASLKFEYLSTYNASISYTQFMGGHYSTVSDHDFASINIGMQF